MTWAQLCVAALVFLFGCLMVASPLLALTKGLGALMENWALFLGTLAKHYPALRDTDEPPRMTKH